MLFAYLRSRRCWLGTAETWPRVERQVNLGGHRGLCDARIDGDDGAGGVAVRLEPAREDRVIADDLSL